MTTVLDQIQRIASRHAPLTLLVLHGSRARGDAQPRSDWDFVYQAKPGFDPDALSAELGESLGTNTIDLANLDTASGLLRFKAASEGLIALQRQPGAFDRFRLDAITAWCDMEPVLRDAYADTLGRIAQ